MDAELLKIALNASGGIAILAVVIVMSWKRQGNGNGSSLPAVSGNGGVQYYQLERLIEEVGELSKSVSDYHRAAEQVAERRHVEAGGWHLATITSLSDWKAAQAAKAKTA